MTIDTFTKYNHNKIILLPITINVDNIIKGVKTSIWISRTVWYGLRNEHPCIVIVLCTDMCFYYFVPSIQINEGWPNNRNSFWFLNGGRVDLIWARCFKWLPLTWVLVTQHFLFVILFLYICSQDCRFTGIWLSANQLWCFPLARPTNAPLAFFNNLNPLASTSELK